MTTSGATAEPAAFRDAIDSMHAAHVRPEIELGSIRPPQRLAPFSYALGAEVRPEVDAQIPTDSDGSAFGRLILLYDPEGHEAWNGTMRLVAFIQAEVDADLASDPMLPEVAWSWLSETLNGQDDPDVTPGVTALGGTVTSTASVRYGDIAGPPKAYQLELRASWTATDTELGPHVDAFCSTLAKVAGLPPVGVSALGARN